MSTAEVDLPFGLGRVTPMTAADVCDWIVDKSDRPRVLGNLNLHGAYLQYSSRDFHAFTKAADRVIIDGWPVLKLAGLRTQAPLGAQHRVGSTDWLELLIERDPELSVVTVGGTASTALGALEHIAHRTSRLSWTAFDGYLYELQGTLRAEDRSLLEAIALADLVLVGMGMPVQERWISARLDTLGPGSVVANVGGCLDYLAGNQRLAPRWMGSLGIEWLYRLVNAPTRLAGRYLWEPLKLAALIVRYRGVSPVKPRPLESRDR